MTCIMGIEHAAAQKMGERVPTGRLRPQAMLRCLRADVADMRARLDTLVAEVQAFQDVRQLKAWLTAYQPVPPPDADYAYW